FGGLGKRRIAKGTRPVDGIGAVAFGQPPGVPALPDAGLVPRAPVRVAGLAPTAAEFGRQIVPGDARLEDAPDAGEDLALVEGRAAGAAQAAGGRGWTQGLHAFPQGIGDERVQGAP